jgi:nicotinamide-nucleotide amidase
MQAEIIAVGSEMLSFGREESNSLAITQYLTRFGIRLGRKLVVPDDAAQIGEALAQALERADVIVLTGGLGPTNDDCTREAVAERLGRGLEENPQLLAALIKQYRRFKIHLSDNNRRQAHVIAGAQVIPNNRGTAPGLLLQEQGKSIFLLPGPPRELLPMLEEAVESLLAQLANRLPRAERQLQVVGLAESRLDQEIEDIYLSYPDIETTVLSSTGVISLHFILQENGDAQAHRLDELVGRIREKLGPAVFSDRGEQLAEVTGRLLAQRGWSLAVAESCTGGMMGAMITDVSGSSTYFAGGVLCYSNSVKTRLLGVKESDLLQGGAVSEPVARQMAVGVQAQLGTDWGLAITGVAGPTGGTAEKPVGLVYLGLSGPFGSEVRKLQLPGDRMAIRRRAAYSALDLLRRRIIQ